MEKLMLPCFNKMLFGIECPGCGAQRAAVLLLKGEFTAAFFMYPAIYSLLILLFFLFLKFFVTFKHARTIVWVLVGVNVLVIFTSYAYKMHHYFQH